MTQHACRVETLGRGGHDDQRHPHGRSDRLTGVSRHGNRGDTDGLAVTRRGQSCGTGRGLVARAGVRSRSARSAAHPGGVVAGRQYQHDRESCESRHVLLPVSSGKTRASAITPVFLKLALATAESSRKIEKIHTQCILDR